ncbi:hypothetical protein JRQ81_020151 [Phrynocephalus forsythii]|uniref:Reverse transcriptase Ty1/copia-type domain-containing protein n=1 Tax=Phrynocephalus forsythii TaxID=171643 RepID=A0A9Q0XQR8_9SAUR|nr:hypothetical protein JRQ81_020151 [Phrynocephalus forsythii]
MEKLRRNYTCNNLLDSQIPNLVSKLQKGVYGLKQAANVWNEKLNKMLFNQGFIKSKVDPCLYTRNKDDRLVYILMYVDDLMLCCEDQRHQRDYFQSQQRSGNKVNHVHTSMETGFHKQKELSELLPNNQGYKEVIGKLLYLAAMTRPDIVAAVGILCRRTSSPTQRDWNGIKRVVKYLKCIEQFKFKLPSTENPILVGFTDADWAEDISDNKSTSGYVFFYGGGPINWISRKQGSIACSSTKAEYISAAAAHDKIVWFKLLLADLKVDEPTPITLYEDNQSCFRLSLSEKTGGHIKHIDVKHHIIREMQSEGLLQLRYCPTKT